MRRHAAIILTGPEGYSRLRWEFSGASGCKVTCGWALEAFALIHLKAVKISGRRAGREYNNRRVLELKWKKVLTTTRWGSYRTFGRSSSSD